MSIMEFKSQNNSKSETGQMLQKVQRKKDAPRNHCPKLKKKRKQLEVRIENG
jgi:hypothetical protein